MNLADLAGSERVGKTDVRGQNLEEVGVLSRLLSDEYLTTNGDLLCRLRRKKSTRACQLWETVLMP